MKHALWLRLLGRLTAARTRLQVIDTHAGAGLYDLNDAMAKRSREADAGIVRLMADDAAPAVFAPLKAAVRALNGVGGLRLYPGSPLLTVTALRKGDRYIGCELRPDDQAGLQAVLDERTPAAGAQARALLADGYGELAAGDADRRPVYLIDPPFERGDEYAQIIAGVDHALAARPDAIFAIWAPLKDLETFDALLRGLELLEPLSLLVVEARLRPLLDPMKMNGTAMVLIGAPDVEDLAIEAKIIADWVVGACGEAGGKARVHNLSA